jgi:hypothetical protein
VSKSYQTNIALSTISFAEFAWEIISRLISVQSWAQSGSGDNTTFSNSGAGPVGSGATGVGGLGNDDAWVRISKTIGGVLHEIVFQTGSGSTVSGRVVVSVGAAFTGGTPAANARPTSANEKVIFDGNIVTGLNATMQMVLETATPFGFFAWAYDNGTRVHSGFFGMVPLTDSDTVPGDPYVYGAGRSYAHGALSIEASNAVWWHYERYGLSGAGWDSAPMCLIHNATNTIYPFGAGNETEDTSKTRARPIVHANLGSGDYGLNSWFEWPSTDNGNANLYTKATTGDRIQVGSMVLKYWNNTVPS